MKHEKMAREGDAEGAEPNQIDWMVLHRWSG
jgi:hypothetical protein